MKKFSIKVFTTSPDFCPQCVMDEFSLAEFLDFDHHSFIKIEDDTFDVSSLINTSSIVGIEIKEINNLLEQK